MKYLIFLFTSSIIISCSVNGFTNDYGKLSTTQKSSIKELENFSSLNSEHIYLINGSQLKTELKNNEKSLVYIFTNGCKSKYCKPLFIYENFARENGYKLYLVMDGFKDLEETTKQPLKSNLFAIDSKYYNTNIRSSYNSKFENELLQRYKSYKSEYLGNLYFFEKDNLVTILRDLPN